MPHESDRTTLFLKWARVNISHSFVFEAKICKEKSLPFVAVKEHQENALLHARNGHFSYKIPDVGFDQKPFDGFQIVNQPAYVVIFWNQSRGDRRLTIIDINTWIDEKQKSDRKSLTFERAHEISFISSSL